MQNTKKYIKGCRNKELSIQYFSVSKTTKAVKYDQLFYVQFSLSSYIL